MSTRVRRETLLTRWLEPTANIRTSGKRNCAEKAPISRARTSASTTRSILGRQAGVERQRERARARVLGDRKHALSVAEALAVVRLQVNRGQVRLRGDAVLGEAADHPVSVDSRGEFDDVDEPRPPVLVVVSKRRLDPLHRGQELTVAGGHLGPGGEDLVVAFELGQAERRGEVVESVVVAEARMRQPLAGVTPALVRRLFRSSLLFRADGHGAPFSGGHLLVRVEREDGRTARGTDGPSSVLGAERLAGVFDDGEPVPGGQGLQFGELRRVVCTGRIAFVRGVIAASTAAGSRFRVRGSMSAKTGVAPS